MRLIEGNFTFKQLTTIANVTYITNNYLPLILSERAHIISYEFPFAVYMSGISVVIEN